MTKICCFTVDVNGIYFCEREGRENLLSSNIKRALSGRISDCVNPDFLGNILMYANQNTAKYIFLSIQDEYWKDYYIDALTEKLDISHFDEAVKHMFIGYDEVFHGYIDNVGTISSGMESNYTPTNTDNLSVAVKETLEKYTRRSKGKSRTYAGLFVKHNRLNSREKGRVENKGQKIDLSAEKQYKVVYDDKNDCYKVKIELEPLIFRDEPQKGEVSTKAKIGAIAKYYDNFLFIAVNVPNSNKLDKNPKASDKSSELENLISSVNDQRLLTNNEYILSVILDIFYDKYNNNNSLKCIVMGNFDYSPKDEIILDGFGVVNKNDYPMMINSKCLSNCKPRNIDIKNERKEHIFYSTDNLEKVETFDIYTKSLNMSFTSGMGCILETKDQNITAKVESSISPEEEEEESSELLEEDWESIFDNEQIDTDTFPFKANDGEIENLDPPLLIGNIYSEDVSYTNFKHYLGTDNLLIIYNDNLAQYNEKDNTVEGGNNGFLRKYRSDFNDNPNRTKIKAHIIGIPTDDSNIEKNIDRYMEVIINLVKKYQTTAVLWSIDKQGELALGVFKDKPVAVKSAKLISETLKNIFPNHKYYLGSDGPKDWQELEPA